MACGRRSRSAVRARALFQLERDRASINARENARGEETMPRNLQATLMPKEGYGLEVDGWIRAQYPTLEAASKVGLELKEDYPHLRVRVFDAKSGTRTTIEIAVAEPELVS